MYYETLTQKVPDYYTQCSANYYEGDSFNLYHFREQVGTNQYIYDVYKYSCYSCYLDDETYPDIEIGFQYPFSWVSSQGEIRDEECLALNGTIERSINNCVVNKRCKVPDYVCTGFEQPFPLDEIGYHYPFSWNLTNKEDRDQECLDLNGTIEGAYINCQNLARCKVPLLPCENPVLVRDVNNNCVCPNPNEFYNEGTNQCEENLSNPCPTGQHWNVTLLQCEDDVNVTCPPDTYLTPAGTCEEYDCPIGYKPSPTYYIDATCIPIYDPNATKPIIDDEEPSINVEYEDGVVTTINPDGTKTVKKTTKNFDGSITTETLTFSADGVLLHKTTNTIFPIDPNKLDGSFEVVNEDGTKVVAAYHKNPDGTYTKTVTYYDADGNILNQEQYLVNPEDPEALNTNIETNSKYDDNGYTTHTIETDPDKTEDGLTTIKPTDEEEKQEQETVFGGGGKIFIYDSNFTGHGGLSDSNITNEINISDLENNLSEEENSSVDYLSKLADSIKNEMSSVHVNDLISQQSVSGISAITVTLFGKTYTLFDTSTIPEHIWEVIRIVIYFVSIISAIIISFSSI